MSQLILLQMMTEYHDIAADIFVRQMHTFSFPKKAYYSPAINIYPNLLISSKALIKSLKFTFLRVVYQENCCIKWPNMIVDKVEVVDILQIAKTQKGLNCFIHYSSDCVAIWFDGSIPEIGDKSAHFHTGVSLCSV